MKTANDIPLLSGPKPINGHASEFRATRGELFVRLHGECGDMGRLRIFNVTATSVAGPELLHELLIEQAKHFEKTLALRIAFYPLAGNGIFTSEGDLWKRQRKLMATLFTPAVVRRYADLMNPVIARRLDTWKDGDVVDAGREMTRITMAVVGKVLFDSDNFEDADELGAAIQIAFNYLADQGASPELMIRSGLGVALLKLGELAPWAAALRDRGLLMLKQPIRWPTTARRKLFGAIRTLDRKINEMIGERRKAGNSRDDLLTRLLHVRDEDDDSVMTDSQVRDEATTLFVAGHETTATSTTWSLYFLSQHPDVYRRWRQEIDALGDRVPTADDAAHMSYTTGIFKEALRLYPPAFMLDRVAMEDVTIGGYSFPRDSVLFIPVYALHRRPELWSDPLRFDPDRFSPEAESKRPRLAWLPFGAGPRICIGASFATLEAQLLLAQIGQRFDFEPAFAGPIGASFMTALRPSRPVLLRLKKRAARSSSQVAA